MTKINIGCGDVILDGYINIDIKPQKGAVFGNALNLLFSDESVDEILAEHLLEHFDAEETNIFFQECKRLLKDNGNLILVCPDMETVLNKYQNNKESIDYVDLFLFATKLPSAESHRQGIYAKKLERLCTKYKFKIVSLTYQTRPHSKYEIKVIAKKIKQGDTK